MDKIILLDRNVISKCNDLLNKKKVDQNIKRELRRLNQPNIFISPLLSILEGSKGINETIKEKELTIKKETSIVKHFFKKAKHDAIFLNENIEEFSKIFAESELEDKANDYRNFIKEINSKLFQRVKAEKREIVENEIRDIAKKYDIDQQHLVVISALELLYGNDNIGYIFKFKKNISEGELGKLAYNAYSDIISGVRIAKIKEIIQNKYNQKIEVEYFSFDKALVIFLNELKISYKTLDDEYGEVSITFKKNWYQPMCAS